MDRHFSMIEYEVYTDGSMKSYSMYDGHGYGGWAYIITRENKALCGDCGGQRDTTNQRMELLAVAEALERIDAMKKFDDVVTIYSDSAYVINCYLKEWYKNWEKNGWVNFSGDPIANKDLWMRIIPFFKRKTYKFVKVKGHAGNYFNEKCDKMAQDKAEELKLERRFQDEVQ